MRPADKDLDTLSCIEMLSDSKGGIRLWIPFSKLLIVSCELVDINSPRVCGM
jgi:hypothetical protein